MIVCVYYCGYGVLINRGFFEMNCDYLNDGLCFGCCDVGKWKLK